MLATAHNDETRANTPAGFSPPCDLSEEEARAAQN